MNMLKGVLAASADDEMPFTSVFVVWFSVSCKFNCIHKHFHMVFTFFTLNFHWPTLVHSVFTMQSWAKMKKKNRVTTKKSTLDRLWVELFGWALGAMNWIGAGKNISSDFVFPEWRRTTIDNWENSLEFYHGFFMSRRAIFYSHLHTIATFFCQATQFRLSVRKSNLACKR